MFTIHKYYLNITDQEAIETHEGWKPLSVQFQKGCLCLWAMVNTKAPVVKRNTYVRGTGHDCDDLVIRNDLVYRKTVARYVGTVQQAMPSGVLVWHVFAQVDA